MEMQTDLLVARVCGFHAEIQIVDFITTAKEAPLCKL